MDITSAKYHINPEETENSRIIAVIDGIEWQVPLEPQNTHYAEIMRQVEAGELTIQDAE
tara:strand:+ start:831 stop:1007 length:177 start_codon:yes stop_codon:yes gene_type:complete